MKTLTKEILCKYLPYNVKCQASGEWIEEEVDNGAITFTIHGISIELNPTFIWVELFNKEEFSTFKCIDECFLILHPLSDLIKPIIVKGYNDDKEFVPMVELAKKDMPSEEWMDDTTSFETFTLNDYEHTTYYVYNKDLGRLAFNGRKIYYEDEDYHTSPSGNIELFDLLHQWHFDLYNGIRDGWAIDINTLNK